MPALSIREQLNAFDIWDERDEDSSNDYCHRLYQGRGPNRIYLGRMNAHEACKLLDELKVVHNGKSKASENTVGRGEIFTRSSH